MIPYIDIFYSILHEIEFFNSFFYKQYIIDLNLQIVYNIQDKKQYALSSFLIKNNINLDDKTTTPCKVLPNQLLITPNNYPEYRILLKMNTSLSYFKRKPTLLISNTHTPLNQCTNLTTFLKPPITHKIYILYCDILTNQNLESPEIKQYVFKTLQNVFKKEMCYYQQSDYPHYYVLLKNIDEVDIYKYCKTIKQQFQRHSTIYVHPKFLLMELHNFYSIDKILHKIKNYFYNLNYNPSLLVIKEKIDAL